MPYTSWLLWKNAIDSIMLLYNIKKLDENVVKISK